MFATGYHSQHSQLGIGRTALTTPVMVAFAAGKRRTGRRLNNPVLVAEARVTMIDGLFAGAVLFGLLLNLAPEEQ